MRLFISAGEPSGDLHGANLIEAVRTLAPHAEFAGFGGERMSAAGCRLLAPLCGMSLIWFKAYRHYFALKQLVDRATRLFRRREFDAVVLIDFPGFNWHVARRAHECGVPVFYFVPPQLWAWGAWRVRKMRRWVDHVLCTMPFEQQWFKSRGMRAHYIGHPYFDALDRRTLDEQFVDQQRGKAGRVIALLPGSRDVEVEFNLASFLRAARIVHERHPDTRFLAAALNNQFAEAIRAHREAREIPLEVHAGRTAEILRVADACISVSGSVGLELLYYGVPSVVSYRVHKLGWLLSRLLKKVPWISLVNLLAGKMLFPEHLSCRCRGKEMADQISNWLSQRESASAVRLELARLRDRFAASGACIRAAEIIYRACRLQHATYAPHTTYASYEINTAHPSLAGD